MDSRRKDQEATLQTAPTAQRCSPPPSPACRMAAPRTAMPVEDWQPQSRRQNEEYLYDAWALSNFNARLVEFRSFPRPIDGTGLIEEFPFYPTAAAGVNSIMEVND